MNKNLISKCCHSEVAIGGEGTTHYFYCLKCGLACNTIEDQPIQKEEENTGIHGSINIVDTSAVGHIDSAVLSFKTPTPSDTLFNSFCLVGKISTVHADQIKDQLKEWEKERDKEWRDRIEKQTIIFWNLSDNQKKLVARTVAQVKEQLLKNN